MTKALIGKYFKTLELAKDYYLKMPEWKQKNHSIVQFADCFMIVGNEQIKAVNKKMVNYETTN